MSLEIDNEMKIKLAREAEKWPIYISIHLSIDINISIDRSRSRYIDTCI